MTINTFAKTHSSYREEEILGPRPIRIELRHIENKGVGYNTGYTTLEAFLAPSWSTWNVTPFLDLRGHVFDNGKFAANAGVGLRLVSNCRVYGINAYYDYRNTKKQHYNQISFGLETLGVRWDFRLNSYIPCGHKTSNPYDINTSTTSTFDFFYANYAFIKQITTTKNKVEFAMAGADAETAYHILKHKNIDLYAAAGPYYYRYKNKKAIGGKVRLFAEVYKYLSLELINSYDSRFHENIQGSISINIPLGPKVNVSKNRKLKDCKDSYFLAQRLFQDVERQEIIVLDHCNQTTTTENVSAAINPLTGQPYFFVFVDNTSSSLGTYESPYPTLALAQENSNPGDIIYVFPGNGTTTGMNSGITLQENQKFWGSGVNHLIPTSNAVVSIPAQSNSSPIITNTDVNTEGNAITLAANNAISGFTIEQANNDAIIGTDSQTLEVSSCTFENTTRFTINAAFADNASISITNNQFLNNTNGISFTWNGPSTLICSNNVFEEQISPSNVPVEISANNNSFTTQFENNLFNQNRTGGIRFNLDTIIDANIILLNNTMTNNQSGSQSQLGSTLTIRSTGTNDYCSIIARGNTFSDNKNPSNLSELVNSIYFHTEGAFTTLSVTVSDNTISNNAGAALDLATPVTDTLTLLATNNIISRLHQNGITAEAAETTTTGNITINDNTITDLYIAGDVGSVSGITIAQSFTNLNLTILNNEINGCDGSGIVHYQTSGTLNINISDNTISNCQNRGAGNLASGIAFDNYSGLTAILSNNTFSNDASPNVAIGTSSSGNPTACVTLTGNSSNTDLADTSYSFVNPGSGAFNLAPCNVDSVNVGTITQSGTITPVQSCSNATPCPP